MRKKILYVIFSIINYIIPKNKKYICIYGRKLFDYNNQAILDELITRELDSKYTIFICIEDPSIVLNASDHVKVITKKMKTLYVLFRSTLIFHTHSLSSCSFKKVKRQKIVNMWHGSPLKTIGALKGVKQYPNRDTYFVNASEYFKKVNMQCFCYLENQMLLTGLPRCDYFYMDNQSYNYWKAEFDKVIMFMPTFRNSKDESNSDIDFPILNKQNCKELNKYLIRYNTLVIIKIHPYQRDIDLFDEEYSNIVWYSNEDLSKNQIHLYKLLSACDALITDYSSIYFDYLHTLKPIGFVIDDVNNYGNKRGFIIDNPFSIMPGEKIRDYDDFCRFIKNVVNGIDKYKDERMRVHKLANEYWDGDNAKRLLQYLDLI